MKVDRLCVALVLSLLTGVALAYEIQTHERLSEASFDASQLSKDPKLLQDLGLAATDTFTNSQDSNPRTLKELISDGSRFEDDNIRPLFHFFDPTNDDGLLFFTSPTWALEDKSKIHVLQDYSLRDARDQLYGALTAIDTDERVRFLGKTFESLGRVIHHIEDMAQPQHVRLDAHLNLNLTNEELPFENRSRYEQYTKDNPDKLTPLFGQYLPVNSETDATFLTTARAFWHSEEKNPRAGLGLAEFTNVNFLSAGTNYDTFRYPFPRFEDATPSEDRNANQLLESVGVVVPSECLPPNQPCAMTFLRAPVTDNYRPAKSGINERASTLSIFDQDLKASNKTVSYTNPDTGAVHVSHDVFALNRFNFDEAHRFLIPRAVAYSAGLINYFFRGRLAGEDVEFTDTGVRLRVKNAIDAQQTPAWKDETLYATNSSGQRGVFALAYDYKDASGVKQYGASPPVPAKTAAEGGGDLAPGAVSTAAYDFTFSIPNDAREVHYRIVFRGRLGREEDSVAVGTVEPVSGFLVAPNYVPVDGLTGGRTIYRGSSGWALTQETGKQARNIDWKGWYVRGRPTKVLTWTGPATRYFPLVYDPAAASSFGPNGYLGAYQSNIYQNGELFAVTPRPVLGAALMRDSAGREWLVAVCRDGLDDVVFRRPNQKSDSSFGWSQIGRYTHDAAEFNPPNMPWFFNGKGTEAQAMRSGRLPNGKLWLFRLKFAIHDDQVMFSNEGNFEGKTIQATDSMTCEDELSVCSTDPSSCSGSEHATHKSQRVYEIKPGGQFIVAVDYVDDQPVYATYSSEGVVRYTRDSSYETIDICVPFKDVCGGQFATSQDTVRYTEFRDQVEKISIDGYGDIVLASVKTMNATNYSQIDSKVSSDRSGTGTSDTVAITGHLRYLDLRYGLYSIRSKTTRVVGSASNQDVVVSQGTSFPMPILSDVEQTVGFFNEELPIHTAPLANVQGNVDMDPGGLAPPCGAVDVPAAVVGPYFVDVGPSQIFDPLYIDFAHRGNRQSMSASVDSNKNVFLSEARLDGSEVDGSLNRVGSFNYLTGGDPGIVIPVGTENAIYTIRVIK